MVFQDIHCVGPNLYRCTKTDGNTYSFMVNESNCAKSVKKAGKSCAKGNADQRLKRTFRANGFGQNSNFKNGSG